MKKYIITNHAGHAYQRGANNNPPNYIVNSANWIWATKFDSIQAGIEEMQTLKKEKYKIWEYGTNWMVAKNGVVLSEPIKQLM